MQHYLSNKIEQGEVQKRFLPLLSITKGEAVGSNWGKNSFIFRCFLVLLLFSAIPFGIFNQLTPRLQWGSASGTATAPRCTGALWCIKRISRSGEAVHTHIIAAKRLWASLAAWQICKQSFVQMQPRPIRWCACHEGGDGEKPRVVTCKI